MHCVCRIADIYVVFKATFATVCESSELHISEVIKSLDEPSDTQDVGYDQNVSTFPEQDELLLVAKRMTLVSLYYEFAIACVILLSIVYFIYNCKKINWSEWTYKTVKDTLQPFVLFDCAINIILGPFGNVYFFILGCGEAYVTVALRIGFYLSTISLPAVFSFLRIHKEDPEETLDLKTFAIILFKLALKLTACSSCLATFINVAYPEEPIVRYSYLTFTIVIGLSALSTYYETLVKLVEVVLDWVEWCMPFHDWLNHFTFWPSLVANLSLVGLNSFILYKYINTEGERSTEISLALTLLSLVFAIPVYIFCGIFCGHGPLYRVCRQHCSSSDSTFDSPI